MLLILFLLVSAQANYYCSAYCSPDNCSDVTQNSCGSCEYPFIFNGSECLLDPTSGYQLVGDDSNMVISGSSSSVSCNNYNFDTFSALTTDVSLTLNTQIQNGYFSVRLIFWLILLDTWPSTAYIQIELVGQNQTYTIREADMDSSQSLSCAAAFSPIESFLRFDRQFNHSNSTVQFSIKGSGTNKYYGMKQFILLGKKCHQFCLSCNSSSNTSCSQCNDGYKLSGTTCDINCLQSYGQTNDTKICILCSQYCQECAFDPYNCSSCQTNGTYKSYLLQTNLSCVVSCPSGYFQNSQTNMCLNCFNPDCLSCLSSNSSICLLCDQNYWYDYDCYATCPNGFYGNNSNCSSCDPSCQQCENSSIICSQCSQGFYLYNNFCGQCPSGFFGYNETWQCRDCSMYCASIDIAFDLSVSSQLRIVMNFSQQFDFTTLPYKQFQTITTNDSTIPLSIFNITYELLDSNSYHISLKPVGSMIRISYVQFTVSINNSTDQYYSLNLNLLNPSLNSSESSVVWSYSSYPTLNGISQVITKEIQTVNNEVNNVLAQQYVQEVKKSGLLSVLFPGMQISSSMLACNVQSPQNTYEGMRFWGNFISIEVPQWEKEPTHTHYVFNEKIQNLIQSSSRLLLVNDSKGLYWRFQRIGFSTYFIFDTYIQLILLVTCWIAILLIRCCSCSTKYKSYAYSTLHRFHEIVLYFVWISAMLEWLTFSQHLSYKEISLALSIVAVLYFLIYNFYVVYRLIPYPYAEISSPKFQYFVLYYSYFLTNIRFQQYSPLKNWSARHLLRPYYFRSLSFMRIILILSALPLFYEFTYASISCLVAIQTLQVIRFLLSWPFFPNWRNIYHFTLELFLLFFFVFYLVSDVLIQSYDQNPNSVTDSDLQLYYGIGWTAFAFLFLFNIGLFISCIIEFFISCRYSNRYRMQESRRSYFYELLEDYEENKILEPKFYIDLWEHRSSYVKLLNKIHEAEGVVMGEQKREGMEMLVIGGNLEEKDYDKYETIFIEIEHYEIVQKEKQFIVKSVCIPDVFLKLQPDIKEKQNVFFSDKIQKTFRLTDGTNSFYFQLISKIYSQINAKIQLLVIHTYLKVDQNHYHPAHSIPYDTELLSQWMEVEDIKGKKWKWRLQKLLEGFPIPPKFIKQIQEHNNN